MTDAPRDIPIIFSAPMIRAWLAGEKQMTRRLLYAKRKTKGGVIPASASVLTYDVRLTNGEVRR